MVLAWLSPSRMARPVFPKTLLTTEESLIPAISSNLIVRFLMAVRLATSLVRYRVRARSSRIGLGGMKPTAAGREHAVRQATGHRSRRSFDQGPSSRARHSPPLAWLFLRATRTHASSRHPWTPSPHR